MEVTPALYDDLRLTFFLEETLFWQNPPRGNSVLNCLLVCVFISNTWLPDYIFFYVRANFMKSVYLI